MPQEARGKPHIPKLDLRAGRNNEVPIVATNSTNSAESTQPARSTASVNSAGGKERSPRGRGLSPRMLATDGEDFRVPSLAEACLELASTDTDSTCDGSTKGSSGVTPRSSPQVTPRSSASAGSRGTTPRERGNTPRGFIQTRSGQQSLSATPQTTPMHTPRGEEGFAMAFASFPFCGEGAAPERIGKGELKSSGTFTVEQVIALEKVFKTLDGKDLTHELGAKPWNMPIPPEGRHSWKSFRSYCEGRLTHLDEEQFKKAIREWQITAEAQVAMGYEEGVPPMVMQGKPEGAAQSDPELQWESRRMGRLREVFEVLDYKDSGVVPASWLVEPPWKMPFPKDSSQHHTFETFCEHWQGTKLAQLPASQFEKAVKKMETTADLLLQKRAYPESEEEALPGGAETTKGNWFRSSFTSVASDMACKEDPFEGFSTSDGDLPAPEAQAPPASERKGRFEVKNVPQVALHPLPYVDPISPLEGGLEPSIISTFQAGNRDSSAGPSSATVTHSVQCDRSEESADVSTSPSSSPSLQHPGQKLGRFEVTDVAPASTQPIEETAPTRVMSPTLTTPPPLPGRTLNKGAGEAAAAEPHTPPSKWKQHGRFQVKDASPSADPTPRPAVVLPEVNLAGDASDGADHPSSDLAPDHPSSDLAPERSLSDLGPERASPPELVAERASSDLGAERIGRFEVKDVGNNTPAVKTESKPSWSDVARAGAPKPADVAHGGTERIGRFEVKDVETAQSKDVDGKALPGDSEVGTERIGRFEVKDLSSDNAQRQNSSAEAAPEASTEPGDPTASTEKVGRFQVKTVEVDQSGAGGQYSGSAGVPPVATTGARGSSEKIGRFQVKDVELGAEPEGAQNMGTSAAAARSDKVLPSPQSQEVDPTSKDRKVSSTPFESVERRTSMVSTSSSIADGSEARLSPRGELRTTPREYSSGMNTPRDSNMQGPTPMDGSGKTTPREANVQKIGRFAVTDFPPSTEAPSSSTPAPASSPNTLQPADACIPGPLDESEKEKTEAGVKGSPPRQHGRFEVRDAESSSLSESGTAPVAVPAPPGHEQRGRFTIADISDEGMTGGLQTSASAPHLPSLTSADLRGDVRVETRGERSDSLPGGRDSMVSTASAPTTTGGGESTSQPPTPREGDRQQRRSRKFEVKDIQVPGGGGEMPPPSTQPQQQSQPRGRPAAAPVPRPSGPLPAQQQRPTEHASVYSLGRFTVSDRDPAPPAAVADGHTVAELNRKADDMYKLLSQLVEGQRGGVPVIPAAMIPHDTTFTAAASSIDRVQPVANPVAGTIQTLQQQVEDLIRQNEQLQAENKRLHAENEKLRLAQQNGGIEGGVGMPVQSSGMSSAQHASMPSTSRQGEEPCE